MIRNNERRDIAQKLRRLDLGAESKDSIAYKISDIIGAWGENGICWDYITKGLADLIEPMPERTCGVWRGTPSPYAISNFAAHEDDELWCEHCDVDLDEGWRYCPFCGAKVVS